MDLCLAQAAHASERHRGACFGELKFETVIEQTFIEYPISLRCLPGQLDNIEKQVAQLDLPAEFSDRWYTLHEHLAAARERLLTRRAR